jgi:hypothetical protein
MDSAATPLPSPGGTVVTQTGVRAGVVLANTGTIGAVRVSLGAQRFAIEGYRFDPRQVPASASPSLLLAAAAEVVPFDTRRRLDDPAL